MVEIFALERGECQKKSYLKKRGVAMQIRIFHPNFNHGLSAML